MVFSSVVFVFLFFPILFLLYYLVKDEYKNALLLAGSIIFYAWGEPKYVFLILFSIFVNWYVGMMIDAQEEKKRRIVALFVGVIYNVAILVYFKYSVFFAGIVNSTFGIDLTDTFLVSKTPMPIGISFFTFQILSYLIDVYYKKVPCQRSIKKLGLYILLFPQMIAGPIVRYIDVVNEIDNRTISRENIVNGLKRFMFGFSKKVLLSNSVALIADNAYASIGSSGALSILGAVAYMLQIYYDFSGYSDMAIGMGEMAGFHFLENFNKPYQAVSVQDFWRRWHISLSSWFKDYLYIPLGGNRKGTARTYINLLIVFFVTGLWHGASFNFIVWGLYHGVFQIIERLGLKKALEKAPKVVGKVYTLLVVFIGWIFFRADTLSDALNMIGSIFNFAQFNWREILPCLNAEHLFFLVISLFGVTQLSDKVREKIPQTIRTIALAATFAIALLYMIGSSYNPFIYFRF